MTTDNKDNKFSIGGGDYAEILRHAVAVIEHDKKVQRALHFCRSHIICCF